MDFAPYQSSPPEHNRAFSPPSADGANGSPRTSYDARRSFSPKYQYRHAQFSPPPLQHPQPQRAWSGDGIRSPTSNIGVGSQVGDYFNSIGAREGMVSEFDTTLGLRLDYEACLAYIALPPVGSIILLIMERQSDYVRFHAWQSSLVFTFMFVLHLIFSGSTFLSWVLFLGDLGLMGWLVFNAYRDADTLDRYELPIVGPLASKILDDE
ncbi:hypothetical protein V8F20_004014 [Naviculisporaceae sp. PSN 640]